MRMERHAKPLDRLPADQHDLPRLAIAPGRRLPRNFEYAADGLFRDRTLQVPAAALVLPADPLVLLCPRRLPDCSSLSVIPHAFFLNGQVLSDSIRMRRSHGHTR